MTLEIYSRKTKDDSNYGLGQSIQTEINQLAIIPILSDSIYKDPISAFRELYSNEITSCKISKLKTRIEIKLNSETRVLSIQGFNSMGITREIFHKILKVMGNSGNNNGKNSGLYGIGFFSHVKLSEKMIVHSYSQNGEYFSFISKSGLSFEILPDEFIEKLDQYGTKLILTIKDSINLDKLIQKIKDCMELSIIKTDFILDDVNQLIRQYGSLKELFKDKLQINKKRYSSNSYKIYQSSNDLYDLIIVRKYPITWNNETSAYLLNVPISLKISKLLDTLCHGTSYCEFFINVKDENLINPHVSRDYFTKESEDILTKMLIDDYTVFNDREIDRPDKVDLNDFINNNDRFFKYNVSCYCKTLFTKKQNNFTTCYLEYLDKIDANYEIKGLCFFKTSNLKIMEKLFDVGYFSFITNDRYNKPENIFENITDIKKVLDEIGIKNRYGQIRKTSKVHFRGKLRDVKYIFKTKDPESNLFFNNKQIGLTDLESINKKHLDISHIKEILKDELFLTTLGYKNLDELKDFSLYYVYYIDTNLIPKTEKLMAFIDDEIKIQLISIYHNFKDHTSLNLVSLFIKNYQFKNKTVLSLIHKNIIQTNIYTKDNLELLLKLDNYDN